jgi:hypothetical protein
MDEQSAGSDRTSGEGRVEKKGRVAGEEKPVAVEEMDSDGSDR